MKKHIKLFAIVASLVMVLCFAVACNPEDAVASIAMKTEPTKTEYAFNEDLDLTGGAITVTKNDETETDVDLDADGVTISGYDKTTVGTQTVTVTYGGKTTTFEVTVAGFLTAGQDSSPYADGSYHRIYLSPFFTLSIDFDYTDYNFTSTDETEIAAEYAKAYADLFDGTADEKAAAIAVIGNDIVVRYYYVDDNDNTVVLFSKNKSWGNFLFSEVLNGQGKPTTGSSTRVEAPAGETYASAELTLDAGTYSTTSNLYLTTSPEKPASVEGYDDFSEFIGKEIVFEITVILNGKTYSATASYTVPNITNPA